MPHDRLCALLSQPRALFWVDVQDSNGWVLEAGSYGPISGRTIFWWGSNSSVHGQWSNVCHWAPPTECPEHSAVEQCQHFSVRSGGFRGEQSLNTQVRLPGFKSRSSFYQEDSEQLIYPCGDGVASSVVFLWGLWQASYAGTSWVGSWMWASLTPSEAHFLGLRRLLASENLARAILLPCVCIMLSKHGQSRYCIRRLTGAATVFSRLHD